MIRHIAAFVLIAIAGFAGLAAWWHPGVGDLRWVFISIQSLLFAIFLNGYSTANLIAAVAKRVAQEEQQ